MNKKTKGAYALLSVLTTALLLTSCGKNPETGKYTYNTYLETNPKTWNVHSWQTNDESYITSFTEMGLYDCILNDTKDGYKFVTEMASAFPVDKTQSMSDAEIEKYYPTNPNVVTTSGYVWDIALNRDAKWEDGTAINADTYVESLKRQLDPQMGNFRADSFYASTLVVANAERYFKQGTSTIEPLYSHITENGSFDSSEVCEDGNFYLNLGRYTDYVASVFTGTDSETTLYDVLRNGWISNGTNVELAAQRIIDATCYYLFHYGLHTDESAWKEIDSVSKVTEELMNENIDITIFDEKDVLVRTSYDVSPNENDESTYEIYTTDMLKRDLKTFVSSVGRGGSTSSAWAWMYPLFGSVYNDFQQEWDGTDENGNPTGVGLKKIDDYTIRFYLSKKISLLNLKFALNSNWIVKVDLYDKLTQTTGGKKATSYATNSINNYSSFGPYKLTKYESGKTITMEKNDNWYGYHDDKHQGQFQMTAVTTKIYSEHTNAVQGFEKGELDDLTMNKSDMKTYGNSSRKTTVYESYTQKISINSNRAKLLQRQTGATGVNKTILANDDFRKGLSLSLNRNNFASQTTAGSKGFTGLLNDLYLTDVELGEMYRQTAQGKSVYSNVYGKLGGDPYAAGYSETALAEDQNGYNYQMGVYYIAKAINTELADTQEGHLNNGDKILIEFRVYDDTSETTIDMMNFLKKAISDVLADAVEKVKAEGTYTTLSLSSDIKVTKDENYYDTAKNGGYDMIFSTWGGAAINPYGLMQVYLDSTFESNCEYGFKGKQSSVQLSIDVNGDGTIGNGETKSFNDWYTTMMSSEYTEQDRESDTFNQTEYDNLHNKKLNILAGVETGIINRFEAIPMVARGSSSLTSFKVENGSQSYISLVGYGGVRFMTFNYDDAEWNEFVNSKQYSKELYQD